ncbi:FAD-dependent monooxygenase [Paenibacillus oryzisoli]|uniref:FAD-binding domain-containing protein n=1 Tax=Paenibacillus oryzisoli TaxID=1850517 RepID=A0A197ZX15_9BACL|nr:FAD-dependent monooxygenase [Paenibacillus oryzisoli]OAS13268.1 hypothetical protein A8708_10740 [Paenibacillus oryzisoli]
MGSRAKGVQPRTFEVFEDLGVLEEALAEGGECPLAGIHIGPFTVPWRMILQKISTPNAPYPNTLLIPQLRTDAIMHRLIDRNGLMIEVGKAVESFKHDSICNCEALFRGQRSLQISDWC